jgi:hypothetical protein
MKPFTHATEAERKAAAAIGLDLEGCDRTTALWYKPCCQTYMCLEQANPYNSAKCLRAREDKRCRKIHHAH